ncbi:MAG TPA: hypothetical protein VLA88_02665 [Candidatus Saccharimonadales bacterium]|nr:hypothetical protein [Candidatus Saccharimonadales bacterium]
MTTGFSRPFRPVHTALMAGLFGLLFIGTLIAKMVLMRNFTPPATIVDGVTTMTGPYSYDNNVMDGFIVAFILIAVVLAIVSLAWSWLRPTA